MIEIYDNFFNEETHKKIFEYCTNASYFYGESDFPWTPPVGMISSIGIPSEIFDLFENKKINSLNGLSAYRMYVNCFSSLENPYFHIDGDSGATVLYYPHLEYDLNENGETQFLINDEIRGVLPLPNRLVKFDATLLHRATSFRSRHRFTVAIKYH